VCRNSPSRVHSANATSQTRFGRIHWIRSNLASRKASSLTKPASARQTQEESSWPQGLAGPLIGQKLLQFLKRFLFGGQRVAGPPLLNCSERNAKLGGNLLLCVPSFGREVFELLNES